METKPSNNSGRSIFLSRITARLRSRLINFIIFWAVMLVMILAQWLDQASA